MPELSRSVTVSRTAWLELHEELQLVNDGYEFLDEKRILLAAELLRQRDAYKQARAAFDRLSDLARVALVDAASALGLDLLQVYPAVELAEASLVVETTPAVGLSILSASLDPGTVPEPRPPLLPSYEVERCRRAFRELMSAAAMLAAQTANIKRLVYEYRRTERRVRALENVVMPEIRDDLKTMEEYLDLIDQEEVIRVRCTRERS